MIRSEDVIEKRRLPTPQKARDYGNGDFRRQILFCSPLRHFYIIYVRDRPAEVFVSYYDTRRHAQARAGTRRHAQARAC